MFYPKGEDVVCGSIFNITLSQNGISRSPFENFKVNLIKNWMDFEIYWFFGKKIPFLTTFVRNFFSVMSARLSVW